MGVVFYTQMGLPTAATFLVLSAGLLLARADQGMMATITSQSTGGGIAAGLVPAALVVPGQPRHRPAVEAVDARTVPPGLLVWPGAVSVQGRSPRDRHHRRVRGQNTGGTRIPPGTFPGDLEDGRGDFLYCNYPRHHPPQTGGRKN